MFCVKVIGENVVRTLRTEDILSAWNTFEQACEEFENNFDVIVMLLEESDYGTVLIDSTMVMRGE